MKKIITASITALIFIVLTTIFVSLGAVASELTTDSKPYVDGAQGYSINPPRGWKSDTNQKEVAVVFVNPVADNDGGRSFNTNINVVVMQNMAPEDEDLSRDVKKAKKSIQESYSKRFQDFKMINAKQLKIGGKPAVFIESQFTQEGLNIKNAQLLFVTGGMGYVVTATTTDSGWERYKDLFNDVIKSFELIK